MPAGVYTYSYPDKRKVRWVREPDGVRYWLDDKWQVFLDRKTWRSVVKAMDDESPPPDIDGAPTITTGEIVGWRCWEYHDGYLQSVYHRLPWPPHHPVVGHVGDSDGNGGVYAFKDKAHALALLSKANSPAFLGRVALWGDVVEHQDGYRAEYAKIISLDTASDPAAAKLLPGLRKRYGLDGEDAESLPKVPKLGVAWLVLEKVALPAAVSFGVLALISVICSLFFHAPQRATLETFSVLTPTGAIEYVLKPGECRVIDDGQRRICRQK